MKISDLIDTITTVLSESVTNLDEYDDDCMKHFTAVVEKQLFDTLREKIRTNSEKELTLADVNDLMMLQREWFDVIEGTDEIPCHAPNSRLTVLSLVLAQLIESAVGKSRYEILFPTIQTIEYVASGASLRDHELQLTEFILSDDNRSMIEVLPCLDCASDSGELKHTFIVDGRVVCLTPAEQQRVINHSNETRAYWDAIQRKLEVTLRGASFGTVINCLCESLKAGGYHAKGEGAGQDLDSGSAANVGIKNFFDWFNVLSVEERTIINHCNGRWSESLGESFGRLTRTKNVDYRELDYCVEVLSDEIDATLQNNPQLYTTYPQNRVGVTQGAELEELKADVAAARARLESAIKHPEHYQVTASYGILTRETLYRRIEKFLAAARIGEAARISQQVIELKLQTEQMQIEPQVQFVPPVIIRRAPPPPPLRPRDQGISVMTRRVPPPPPPLKS